MNFVYDNFFHIKIYYLSKILYIKKKLVHSANVLSHRFYLIFLPNIFSNIPPEDRNETRQ